MKHSSDAKSWFGLDPSITFLNHGSFGACPTAILDKQRELQLLLEREPVRFLGRELEGRLDHARNKTAAFLGASPEGFAFIRNATQGVNTVLKSLKFTSQDELLVTNHEYNACRNALDFVAQQSGAKVRVAHIPFPIESPDQVTELLLNECSDRTRLLLIDWVTSPTGLIFPMQQIVREMNQRGILTLVDAAHGPGMLPMDLSALQAPFVTGNFHKWLNTPKGSAFLHVREDLIGAIRPLSISHGANSPRTDRSRFLLEFGFCGTEDPSPWLVTPDTIDFFETQIEGGWQGLRTQQRTLALEVRTLLLETFECSTPPAPDSMTGSLVAFPLPERYRDLRARSPQYFHRWQESLFEDHQIEVPVFFWKGKTALQWSLRISAHVYNALEDYTKLRNALHTLKH